MRRCLLTWLKSDVGQAFLPVPVFAEFILGSGEPTDMRLRIVLAVSLLAVAIVTANVGAVRADRKSVV